MKLIKHTYAAAALLLCATQPANAIVGGKLASELVPYDTPWMAFVVQRGATLPLEHGGCGGTLIAPQWVLTTATCSYEFQSEPLSISDEAGRLASGARFRDKEIDVLFSQNGVIGAASQRSRVIEVHRSPDHRVESLSNGESVLSAAPALLKLEQPVTMPTIKRGTIADVTDYSYFPAHILGFGSSRTQFGIRKIPQTSKNRLRAASLYIDPNFRSSFPGVTLGASPTSSSACTMDDGGPVVARNRTTGEWVQIGVLADGQKCYLKRIHPHGSSFADSFSLETYAEWIDAVIGDQTDSSVETLAGNVSLDCYAASCTVNTSGVSAANGDNVSTRGVTVRDLNDPDGWMYAVSEYVGDFRAVGNYQYEVTVFADAGYYTDESRWVQDTYVVGPNDSASRPYYPGDGYAQVECEPNDARASCRFSTTSSHDRYFERWTIGEMRYYTDHILFNTGEVPVGRHRVTYTARGVDGSKIRETFFIDRKATDRNPYRVTTIKSGQLERGRAIFPYGADGEYMGATRVVATLRSSANGVRMLVQRYDAQRSRWIAVRETAGIRTSRGIARMSVRLQDYANYRVLIISPRETTDYHLAITPR